MADEVQRIEEENSSLRDRIEEIQQKRRAGFSEGDELTRAVSAYEENERLKRVLKAQQETLEREEKARESVLSDEPVTDENGLELGTPYTLIDGGVRVSDPIVVDEDGDKSESDTPETPSVNDDRSSRLAELAHSVSASDADADGDDDQNKEN